MATSDLEIEGQGHKTIAFVALPIYTQIPNLKVLTKIFFKLSRPKGNLCGGGGVTVLNPKYPRLSSGDTTKFQIQVHTFLNLVHFQLVQARCTICIYFKGQNLYILNKLQLVQSAYMYQGLFPYIWHPVFGIWIRHPGLVSRASGCCVSTCTDINCFSAEHMRILTKLEDRSQKKKIMFLHSKNKASRKGYKGEC